MYLRSPAALTDVGVVATLVLALAVVMALLQTGGAKAVSDNAEGWTEMQSMVAKSLEGATMPNGQKYEEWKKSKGRAEDAENE